ncbi:hypothetical protein [Mesorhizobium sp. M0816]|uniref:hypothetical protein n=1 Tax=Mesorhizobium sp. M0816 TaxID=2957006 RepID=UPI0033352E63
MRIAVLLLLGCLAVAPSTASADIYDVSGQFGGSYLCIGAASGGVRFDAATGKWIQAKFGTEDDKFVVAVKPSQVKQVPVFGIPTSAMQYGISVRPLGRPASDCSLKGIAKDIDLEGPTVSIFPSGRVQCTAALSDYDFNFSDLRFMLVYAVGFIDGKDDSKNTPYIEIGTCSRID